MEKTLEIKLNIAKKDIEEILGFSKNVPEKELHVFKGSSEFGRNEFVSLALIANSDYTHNYTIGFIDKLKVVYTKEQSTPFAVNNALVKREKKEFRNNRIYTDYRLHIISPPIGLYQFLGESGSLNPNAAVDRACE